MNAAAPAAEPANWPRMPARTLGVLALALAVLAWGYGGKLSLFQVHRDSAARMATAKLWVDSRSERVVTLALRRIASPPFGAATALPQHHETLADFGCAEFRPPELPRGVPFSLSVLPRSPPRSRLGLA